MESCLTGTDGFTLLVMGAAAVLLLGFIIGWLLGDQI